MTTNILLVNTEMLENIVILLLPQDMIDGFRFIID